MKIAISSTGYSFESEVDLRFGVTGLAAQYPLPGVTWDYLQYVQGLKELGHDAYYFEDTGLWPYNPLESGISETCEYNVEYLSTAMAAIGLPDRWAYRFPHESKWFGLSDSERDDVLRSADLLINVSGTLANLHEYGHIPVTAYVDTDPVFTQVKLARGQLDFQRYVNSHDVHFSFGETLPGSTPETGHRWIATRQPIVLAEWTNLNGRRDSYTTVMNWSSYNNVTFEGIVFGQKDVEFLRFLDLPDEVTSVRFEAAMNRGKNAKAPFALLEHKHWNLVDPEAVFSDMDSYRSYIGASRGEWSVAKNGYVLGKAGWFSCRSACYLAASRPVVVQDTGFSEVLPTGEGLIAFSTMDEAIGAIETVESDYERHCKAAREIAEEYFDSRKVLTRLIEDVFSSSSSGGGTSLS